MKKPIQISIPAPCHENWDAMTPEAKGRFCAACQKTVIDFTKSSDREIASVLKNTNNACGRFRSGQLDRDLVIPQEKSSLWMAASAAVVCFLTIGNDIVSAQTPVNTEQNDLKTENLTDKAVQSLVNERKIIAGQVCEKNEGVIPGANIENINTQIQTQTDINGNFAIEAKTGDKLIVSFFGLTNKEFLITSDNNLVINVEMEWMGVMIESKRTFFGGIFHSIGNIFR